MNRGLSLIAMAFLMAAGGCQGSPHMRRVVESYNAEARQLEDYIYLMEQDIQVLEQENSKLRRRIELGGGLPSGPVTPPATRRGGSGPRRDSELGPPIIEGPMIEMPDVPQRPPSLPIPPAPRPLGNKPAQPIEPPDPEPVLAMPGKESPARINVPAPEITPSDLPAPPQKRQDPEVIDQKITHLHLNPLHTGGADFDHTPGDDGLSILVEPRNAADQFVPLAGPVSVVVLDPAKSGDEARIARWDFSQEQAQEKLTQGNTRGIHLRLPWPAKSPESARLEVFVRYGTPDGKKLQAEREIFVALPGQFSERWTPRPAERQRKERHMETNVARSIDPSAALESKVVPAVPLPSPAQTSPAAKPVPVKDTAAPILPPAGLSERPPGEKPARPKWSATR